MLLPKQISERLETPFFHTGLKYSLLLPATSFNLLQYMTIVAIKPTLKQTHIKRLTG